MRLLPLIFIAIVALGGVYTASYLSVSTSLDYRLVVTGYTPWAPMLVIENRGPVRTCITGLHAILYLDRVEYAAIDMSETICIDPSSSATILLAAYETPLWSPARLLDLLRSLYGELRDMKLVVRLEGTVLVKPDLPGAQPIQEAIEAKILVDYHALAESLDRLVNKTAAKALEMRAEGREATNTFERRASSAAGKAIAALDKSISEANQLLEDARGKAGEVGENIEKEAMRAREAIQSFYTNTSRVVNQVLQRLEKSTPQHANLDKMEQSFRIDYNNITSATKQMQERLRRIEDKIQELIEEVQRKLNSLNLNVTRSSNS